MRRVDSINCRGEAKTPEKKNPPTRAGLSVVLVAMVSRKPIPPESPPTVKRKQRFRSRERLCRIHALSEAGCPATRRRGYARIIPRNRDPERLTPLHPHHVVRPRSGRPVQRRPARLRQAVPLPCRLSGGRALSRLAAAGL